jgi:nonsense-mediated mRNA decay protein 3
MFCVDCGEEKTIYKEGSCFECYVKNHQFTKGPSIFHLMQCKSCDAFKYKTHWKALDFETIVKQNIKNEFSISPELNNVEIFLDCNQEEDAIFCKITFSGLLDEKQVTEEHFVEIRLKYNACDICSKRFGGYHEAIVQIRPGQRKLSREKRDEIQSFVEEMIRSMQEKGNRKLFLTDLDIEHGGLTFFISDKQSAFSIIKKVQDHFGGDVQISSKNVGMKDGKQLYRDTYLLRLLPFQEEDVFRYKDEYYFVLHVGGNQIHVVNLMNYTDSFLQASDVEQGIFIATSNELSFTPVLVNETEQELQLMHPKTYAVFTLKKPSQDYQFNDETRILQINEYFFIKPKLK